MATDVNQAGAPNQPAGTPIPMTDAEKDMFVRVLLTASRRVVDAARILRDMMKPLEDELHPLGAVKAAYMMLHAELQQYDSLIGEARAKTKANAG